MSRETIGRRYSNCKKKSNNAILERIDVACDSVIVPTLSGTLLGTEEGCLYLSTCVPHSGSRFYESADSNGHIVEVERRLGVF